LVIHTNLLTNNVDNRSACVQNYLEQCLYKKNI
jgi:hypothetical protein